MVLVFIQIGVKVITHS